MDILCIDQRNETERVAVTQYIPAIFRSALRTLAVRDSTGVRLSDLGTPNGRWTLPLQLWLAAVAVSAAPPITVGTIVLSICKL